MMWSLAYGGGLACLRGPLFACVLAVICALCGSAQAQQTLSAFARFDAAQSRIERGETTLTLELSLTRPVPWRVGVLAEPARLVIDTQEVDWQGIAALNAQEIAAPQFAQGAAPYGWSRLILPLPKPMIITQAEMQTAQGTALLRLRLQRVSAAQFAAAAQLEPLAWESKIQTPDTSAQGLRSHDLDRILVVAIDPGHGGVDPGALTPQGQSEAALMLRFARELKELLLRDGRFHPVLTRNEDVSVPLSQRIALANSAGADVLISLHADSLSEGHASGAALYTLSDEASSVSAQALAARHDRDDLLLGVDIPAQGDVLAGVLLDMARVETTPQTARLAHALEGAIKAAGLKMHQKSQHKANFAVLKAPEIPSVLLELGFLSSQNDLALLGDKTWRDRMAQAVLNGIALWAAREDTLDAASGGALGAP